MAVSSIISGYRPKHRAAQLDPAAPFQEGIALDWANGQATAGGTSTAFDTARDVVVMVTAGGSSSCVGFWITVSPAGTAASAGAGSMWIGANQKPAGIYVAAGQLINGLQAGSGGVLSMIPALTASN